MPQPRRPRRDLQLAEQHRGRPGQARDVRRCRLRVEGGVRASSDDDGVFALAVDLDQGDAGRLGDANDSRDVNAARGEVGEDIRADRVAADSADEQRFRSRARSRDRLVRTLAPGGDAQRSAEHRLTGKRMLLDQHGVVAVRGTEHDERHRLLPHRTQQHSRRDRGLGGLGALVFLRVGETGPVETLLLIVQRQYPESDRLAGRRC